MENIRIQIDEGKYVIQVQALKSSTDEPSAMAPYLSKNSIVTNENGELFLTLMLTEQHIITGLQIKGPKDEYISCLNQHTDEETNSRYENFEIDSLQTIHEARVQYKVDHEGKIFEGDEELRLFFDSESVLSVDNIQF